MIPELSERRGQVPVQELRQAAPGVAVGRRALQRQDEREHHHALNEHQRNRPAQHLPLEHRRLRRQPSVTFDLYIGATAARRKALPQCCAHVGSGSLQASFSTSSGCALSSCQYICCQLRKLTCRWMPARAASVPAVSASWCSTLYLLSSISPSPADVLACCQVICASTGCRVALGNRRVTEVEALPQVQACGSDIS